jgi:hypothetical protein
VYSIIALGLALAALLTVSVKGENEDAHFRDRPSLTDRKSGNSFAISNARHLAFWLLPAQLASNRPPTVPAF